MFEDRFRKCTIEHVTLPEGASRAAARSQIDTDTLERIREDVLPALATGVAVAVPGNPDYLLRPLAASEGALAVRLESVAGAELTTIGIGWSDPGASEVWQSMAVATEEPRRPWIADALALESLTALGDEGVAVALWSGALARCLAWAAVAYYLGRGVRSKSWHSELHRHIAGRDDCVRFRMSDITKPQLRCGEAAIRVDGTRAADAALPFLSAGAALRLASMLQRLQLGEFGADKTNRWSWDFASGHRIHPASYCECRGHCSIVRGARARQTVAGMTRWADAPWRR